MTEDHEPINPILHDHLTGLGYTPSWQEETNYKRRRDTYYREEENKYGSIAPVGMSVDVYRDGSIRIGGKPDAHTGDLLRFLADTLGEGEADDQH